MQYWGAATNFCTYTSFSNEYTRNLATNFFLKITFSNNYCLHFLSWGCIPQVEKNWKTPHTIILHEPKNCMRMQFWSKSMQFDQKLHLSKIIYTMQLHHAGCHSTRLGLRNAATGKEIPRNHIHHIIVLKYCHYFWHLNHIRQKKRNWF